jgi:drug/metabolite transporter (DMT)-like permease
MSRTRANLLLLFAAALWGFGNVAQKTVLEHLDPFSAVGLRCLIAAVLVAPLLAAERASGPTRGWIASQLRVSVPFALAMALQQTAFLDTTVTNASFLINTATVMTPVAAWCLLRERPTANVALAACMTVAGAFLLSGGIGGGVGLGDRTAILSAACYALWMVELGRHARAHGRPVATATVQFALTALLLVPIGALRGGLSPAAAWAAGPELLVLGVFSTAIAFGVQTVALRFTSASHAAVVVSAESLFGALAAAALLGERVSPAGAFGGLLVLAAIALVAFGRPHPAAARLMLGAVLALGLVGPGTGRAREADSVSAADMRAGGGAGRGVRASSDYASAPPHWFSNWAASRFSRLPKSCSSIPSWRPLVSVTLVSRLTMRPSWSP